MMTTTTSLTSHQLKQQQQPKNQGKRRETKKRQRYKSVWLSDAMVEGRRGSRRVPMEARAVLVWVIYRSQRGKEGKREREREKEREREREMCKFTPPINRYSFRSICTYSRGVRLPGYIYSDSRLVPKPAENGIATGTNISAEVFSATANQNVRLKASSVRLVMIVIII
jgi:hypothetical protein